MEKIYVLLGFIIGKVFRYRNSVIVQNMSRSFPDESYNEIKKKKEDYYQNLGRLLFENIICGSAPLKVTEKSLQLLSDLQKENRHIILLLGHYGNWEATNQLHDITGLKVQVLYKPIKNIFFNKLMIRRRTKHGVKLINYSNSLRTLARQKDCHLTLFIADQFTNGRGLSVNFLNQKTHVFNGAENIAKYLNAYVGYAEIIPNSNFGWQLSINTISNAAGNSIEGDISQSYIKELEKSIKKDPSLWLWSHKRWK
ncbi:lysophospholipid acyltransferase family protein [Flavobacterium sp. JAS]|uniref:lysophospholipid acyltransferase family protein n=1 Tax=Flavobacterium sp. JAS TaxID=2897329 RepID=UPI001E59C87E|nr:lysophospholipid acyltransferase family protein [Flavobacterium sp. JAS]MCD0472595.1 lysophospholipid acyltransferase family protein [Flavobacterium sp. JAS]